MWPQITPDEVNKSMFVWFRSMAEKSRLFGRLHFPGFSYTDIPPVVTPVAYLSQKNVVTHGLQGGDGCHLVICVHGLDGKNLNT